MEPSAPIKNESCMFGFRNEVNFLVDSGGDCFYLARTSPASLLVDFLDSTQAIRS